MADHRGYSNCHSQSGGGEVVQYEIETQLRSGEWSAEAVGDRNEFDTETEALAAIGQLKEIDEEWAVAEYRVVAVKESEVKA
jgi:hypothetical protein